MAKKIAPKHAPEDDLDIDYDDIEEFDSLEGDEEEELDADGNPIFKHRHDDTVVQEATKNNYYDVPDSEIEENKDSTLVWLRSKPMIYTKWLGIPFTPISVPYPVFPLLLDYDPIDICYYKIRNYNKNVNAAFDTILFSELHLAYGVVNSLFRVFQRADDDKGFGVDILELLMFLDVERTPFTTSLFSLMDADGGGDLNFVEFAVCYWNYCSLNMNSLYHFVFDMVSNKSDPEMFTLDEEAINKLIKNLFGEHWEEASNKHAKAAHAKLLRLW